MQKFSVLLLVLLSASLSCVFGQDLPSDLPLSELSAKAHLEQTIGVTQVSLDYYRPNKQGREIWGELVPYGEVWRAGANNTTTISLSTPVLIEGEALAAGTYSLFVLPQAKSWTFIFDSSLNQFGAFFYSGQSDVLRVEVPVQKWKKEQESLSFSFDKVVENRAELSLSWGKRGATLHLETDEAAIHQNVLQLAERAAAEKNSRYYTACVSWAIDHGHFIDQAAEWLAASLAIKPGFGNQLLQCRLWAYHKEYDKALAQLDRLGESYPQFMTIVSAFKKRWEVAQKL